MLYRNILILLLLAVISASLSAALLNFFPNLPAIVLVFITNFIFLLMIILFNLYLWRYFSALPDISGDWIGNLATSRSESSHIEPAKVRIIQRWVLTRVDFIGTYATSSSLAAIFFKDRDGVYTLAYLYKTTPVEGGEEEVPHHIGLCILRMVDKERLSGRYHYMGSGDEESRFIHGQLVLTRPK